MNLDTPEGRLAAAESLGTDGYNRAMREHHQRQTISTVAGHDLRSVSSRFGRLVMVGKTGVAFHTLPEAEKYANDNPAEEI